MVQYVRITAVRVIVAAVVLAVAAFVALAFAGVFDRTATARVSGAGTAVVRVALVDTPIGFDVDPDVVEVAPGTRLVLDVVNEGSEDHDLAVAGGRRRTRTLHAGESQRLDVGVVRGDLSAWCTLSGHRLFGMSLAIRAVGGG